MSPSTTTYALPLVEVHNPKAQRREGERLTNVEADDESMEELLELDTTLKACFTAQIEEIAKLESYRKVAALLISWGNEHPSQLDTSGEIRDLRTVLEDSYHFSVHELLLKSCHGLAKHQLTHELGGFLSKHDRKDTLLIIYYGGHGVMDVEGGNSGLTIAQGNCSNRNHTSILWTEVEGLLQSTLADRLLIFDCCHAGVIERLPRGLREQSLYEFIGSTPFRQTAVGPGPYSFTRALISSLEKLSVKIEGFPVSDLLHEIKTSPDFLKTGQQPVSSELSPSGSFKRLLIRPLREASLEHVSETNMDHQNVDGFRCDLTLKYTFYRKPTEAHVRAMAKSISSLIKQDEVPIRRTCWQRLGKSLPADCVETAVSSAMSSDCASLVPSQSGTISPTAGLEFPAGTANPSKLISVPATTLLVQRSTEDNSNVAEDSHLWSKIVSPLSPLINRRMSGRLFVFCLGVSLAAIGYVLSMVTLERS